MEISSNIEAFRNILVQLFHQPVEVVENERLEIKGWCRDEKEFSEKIVESASCIANAKGGMVLGGISGKKASFSACPYPNVNCDWIEARVKDNSVPSVECEVVDLSELLADIRGTHGANLFGLVVPQSRFLGTHVTTKGISKIRVGKECKPYFTTADDDRTRAFVRGVSAADLSTTSIQWAMAQHQKKFKTGDVFEEPLEFLARARLVEPVNCGGAKEYKVTLAAVIMFGKEITISRVLPFFETVISLGPSSHLRVRRNVIESIRDLVISERSPVKSHPSVPT
jgi:predicted HTH transcriptional regulator